MADVGTITMRYGRGSATDLALAYPRSRENLRERFTFDKGGVCCQNPQPPRPKQNHHLKQRAKLTSRLAACNLLSQPRERPTRTEAATL